MARSEGVKGYEFNRSQKSNQGQEHVQRGEVVRRGCEERTGAAKDENESQQGEKQVDAQALALPVQRRC